MADFEHLAEHLGEAVQQGGDMDDAIYVAISEYMIESGGALKGKRPAPTDSPKSGSRPHPLAWVVVAAVLAVVGLLGGGFALLVGVLSYIL